MLELEQVRYSYGKIRAIRGISLKLPSKGLVSLIGPNGSGKSTLLKCINRINRPSGKISLDGEDLSKMAPRKIASTFGFVPQETDLALPMNVFDLILLGRMPYLGWTPTEEDLEVVSENIEKMGLKKLALRRSDELSGGERQKVLIARALSQEPKVLLLDEPTSKLDIKHKLMVMRLIRDIVDEKGLLAVMAIHDLNTASQYSDVIVMLKKGKMHCKGKPTKTLTKKNIRSVYDINVAIHGHGSIPHIVPVENADVEPMERTT